MIKRFAFLTLALVGLAFTAFTRPPPSYWAWEGRVFGYVSGYDDGEDLHLQWEACLNTNKFAYGSIGCNPVWYVDDLAHPNNLPVTTTELGDTRIKLYGASGSYLTFDLTDITYLFNPTTANMLITGGTWTLVLNQSNVPGYYLAASTGSIETSGLIPVPQALYYGGNWYPSVFVMGCDGYLQLTGYIKYYTSPFYAPPESGGYWEGDEDMFDFLPAEDN